jgi:poly-gamma-glutamate synthesis protein (capsule biosynthesis protein)
MRSRLLAVTALLVALAVPGHARTGDPVFHGSISVIDAQLRERMAGSSWHRGCPVRIRDLRLLRLDRWGFDGTVRRGRLIVHEDQARRVKRVFSRLFDAHFRIRRMRLIDFYNGSDDRSMDANNTSAFNCRFVAGTTRWSQHAYGRAIDINPIRNPYVAGSHVSPEAGRPFADRSRHAMGMIHGGDAVVRAFAAANWKWGGYWSYPTDYMHFSRNGH